MTIEEDILIKQNQNIPNLKHYDPNYQTEKVELTEEQKSKLELIISETTHFKELDKTQNFINQSCYLRYLKAHKWCVDHAKKGLESTILWRNDFRPDLMKPEEFYVEGNTGKIYCNGYDKENRPILIMDPSMQNTNDSKAHIRFTVFSIETAIKMLTKDVEKLTILIDLRKYALKHSVSLSEAKEVLHILSHHYPERLGRAFIVDAPWVFSSFFKIISPWLDPVTRDKIRFVDSKKKDENHLENFINKSQLFKEFGGHSEFKYDPDRYFEQVEMLFNN